ncbi:glycosyl transferase family 1, partial [Vibrio sp. 10N.286.49.E1]
MLKKKILVLTPRYPYPVIGGDRLRIFEICRELSKNYSLTLLSLCETQSEMEMDTPSDGVFSSIHR